MTDFTSHGGGERAELATLPGVAMQTSFGGALQVRRAAHALPRRMSAVREMISQMAELVEPVGDLGGDEWEYRFPVKNKRTGRTDWIEGPSVKCTNVVARAFGNCALMVSRVDDQGASWMIYATFIDYQSGFEITRAFQQRKGQSSMGSDRARGEDIDFQIGVSKAMRNVVSAALSDLVAYALRAKDRQWRGKIADDPDAYRSRIKARLDAIGYPIAKVEAYTGAGRIDRWPVEVIAQISKILSAHAEGALTELDTVFDPQSTADPMDTAARSAPAAPAEPRPADTAPPGRAEADTEPPARRTTPPPKGRRNGDKPTFSFLGRSSPQYGRMVEIAKTTIEAASAAELDELQDDVEKLARQLEESDRPGADDLRAAYASARDAASAGDDDRGDQPAKGNDAGDETTSDDHLDDVDFSR